MAFALLVLGAVGPAAAEQKNVFFRRTSSTHGLPAAAVREMSQDAEGFLWLATQDGLSRYDGYEFTIYRHDPEDEKSLPHNDVWTVHEDRHGTLWVGTDGGGVSRFDPATGAFEHFRHDASDSTSLSEDRVRVLLEDGAGKLWVGTDGGGLGRLDPERRAFSPAGAGLRSGQVRDILEASDGRLWVATDGGGVGVLDSSGVLVATYQYDAEDPTSLASNRVRVIAEDGGGVIWVGTYDEGLTRLDPVTGRATRYRFDPQDPFSLSNDKVGALYLDDSGTLWVGTDSGLNEWRPEREDFLRHLHSPANPFSLSHNTVTSIFQDRGGVLWVGTYRGLNSWNTRSGTFLHEFHRADDSSSLSNDYVTSFAEDGVGRIWIGTFGGLNRLDRSIGEYAQFRHQPEDRESLSQDQVMSLLVDRKGRLWVGTRNGGLNLFDESKGSFERFVHDPRDASSLGANGVTSLLEGRDGTLWVGTFKGGLNRFDPETRSFRRYRHDRRNPRSLSGDRVMSIYEDAGGVLWIATENAGLNRFDPQRGTFRNFRHHPSDPRSLSSDEAWIVTGDARGDLWIGTNGAGLNRWTAEDRAAGREVFQHYSPGTGLPSSVVYSVVPDGDGSIWVSTNGGLSHIFPRQGRIINFDTSHGLQADEFNYAAGFLAADGEIFFGGINGFNRFYPERLRPNDHVPPVVLTRFEKFNEPVDFDRPPWDVDAIRLSYKDSVVGFHFAALDYTAPEKNRYRFKLEGFDREWIEAGPRRQATYTNLDPGDYVFRVRASNNDEVWSTQDLAVQVSVAPPPWRTWWAYGLYGLGATGLMAAVMASFASKRRRAQELERINISLTREISERRAKERALEAERRKARQYLDVAEVIMLALNSDGTVALINQKGCRILGREEGAILGRRWVESFVPAAHRDQVRKRLSDIGAYQYYEYPVLNREGEERIIAWHSSHIPASGDDPAVILSSGSDVTQVRELETHIRLQQKMEALGTLAGGVAHDFNNILTAIFGYSTLTLGQLPPESEEAGYIGHVVRACERAKDLVSRILTFSRRGEQDKRAIDIGEVVTEACQLLRSSLPATIEVRTNIEPDCLPVMADPTQIHQVVMNLATNAGHAMPSGGLLEISVEQVDIEEASAGQELRSGAHIVLTVRDTGHGMDAATVEKIFDPFFTTKKIGDGTGLGLSVVHGIVKSHGGEISVTSRPGRGTRFLVHLPCTQVRRQARAADQLSETGSERILIVDDEKLICTLAQKILENLGYTVSATTDCDEALGLFLNDARGFDLLLTDQMMPRMTGLELAETMRRTRPDLPVVVASGRKTPELERDDVVFLQKPFKVAEIGTVVRRTLDGSGGDARSELK